MKVNEFLNLIRGAVRPYLAFIFPTAIVLLAVVIVLKFLPVAAKFIDRDIALIIIATILTIVTAVVTSAINIMFSYFGERAGRTKEQK